MYLWNHSIIILQYTNDCYWCYVAITDLPASVLWTSSMWRYQVLCLSWVTFILGFRVITWVWTVRMAEPSKWIHATFVRGERKRERIKSRHQAKPPSRGAKPLYAELLLHYNNESDGERWTLLRRTNPDSLPFSSKSKCIGLFLDWVSGPLLHKIITSRHNYNLSLNLRAIDSRRNPEISWLGYQLKIQTPWFEFRIEKFNLKFQASAGEQKNSGRQFAIEQSKWLSIFGTHQFWVFIAVVSAMTNPCEPSQLGDDRWFLMNTKWIVLMKFGEREMRDCVSHSGISWIVKAQILSVLILFMRLWACLRVSKSMIEIQHGARSPLLVFSACSKHSVY
jgi:hypothetical protein